MSKLTKLARAWHLGPILDAIEASGATEKLQADLKDVETVAVSAIGSTIGSIFTAQVASHFGISAHGFVPDAANALIQDFEAWIEAKLTGPSEAKPK